MQGWECPRCKTINAPWKGSCDCKVKKETKPYRQFDYPWQWDFYRPYYPWQWPVITYSSGTAK